MNYKVLSKCIKSGAFANSHMYLSLKSLGEIHESYVKYLEECLPHSSHSGHIWGTELLIMSAIERVSLESQGSCALYWHTGERNWPLAVGLCDSIPWVCAQVTILKSFGSIPYDSCLKELCRLLPGALSRNDFLNCSTEVRSAQKLPLSYPNYWKSARNT